MITLLKYEGACLYILCDLLTVTLCLLFLTAEATTTQLTRSMAKRQRTTPPTRSSERSSKRQKVEEGQTTGRALEYSDEEGPNTQDFEGRLYMQCESAEKEKFMLHYKYCAMSKWLMVIHKTCNFIAIHKQCEYGKNTTHVADSKMTGFLDLTSEGPNKCILTLGIIYNVSFNLLVLTSIGSL